MVNIHHTRPRDLVKKYGTQSVGEPWEVHLSLVLLLHSVSSSCISGMPQVPSACLRGLSMAKRASNFCCSEVSKENLANGIQRDRCGIRGESEFENLSEPALVLTHFSQASIECHHSVMNYSISCCISAWQHFFKFLNEV